MRGSDSLVLGSDSFTIRAKLDLDILEEVGSGVVSQDVPPIDVESGHLFN